MVVSLHNPYFAFFVTPHGYGHMSRAIAVAESLRHHLPNVSLEFFTTVPKRHIASSINNFDYYHVDCDVGLVQSDTFEADLPQTIDRLDRFLPFDPNLIDQLATHLLNRNCIAVISDIAALGIETAARIGLPSVLIENFTWDWIYREHKHKDKRMEGHAEYLSSVFLKSSLHLQCEPYCEQTWRAISINPISRAIRTESAQVREALGCPPDKTIVFISMGGISYSLPKIAALERRFENILFVIAGHHEITNVPDNVHLLPTDSTLFHPDLVNAAGAVIGKVGYSTITEVYQATVPFGYFSRPENPENTSLLSFLEKNIRGIHFSTSDYDTGGWLDHLPVLLDMPRDNVNPVTNGSDQCATEILKLLKYRSS